MDHVMGRHSKKTLDVPVVATDEAGKTYTRRMNSVLDENGNIDRPATIAQAKDIVRGMAEKIKIGVLTPDK